jgi:lysophospholipase L1-like esterase
MKVKCLGDSLTFGYGMDYSHAWPNMVAKKSGFEVVNKGICGDTTAGMLSRLHTDVINENATHVIITGGTNDLIWNAPLSIICSNLASIAMQAIHNEVIPIIGVPIPVYTEKAKSFKPVISNLEFLNSQLSVYRNWIISFCDGFKFHIADFYKYFYNLDNNSAIAEYYYDGLHPNTGGNAVMSQVLLLNSLFVKNL